MKKSKLKLVVRNAMQHYYKQGLTTTADKVRNEIWSAIDKAYKEKNKK